MAALDTTTFDAALKQHYTPDRVFNMVYAQNPFLAMVPKMERFGGRNLPIPIVYGVTSGRSASFATAYANKNPGSYEDFVLTRAKDYSLADVENEVAEASRGDANAFMDAVTSEVDLAIRSITRSLAPSLYGSGSGSLGAIASGEGTVTITLSDTESVVNFEKGMVVVASSTDGGGGAPDRVGGAAKVTITGVDRDAGTLTAAAAWDTLITDIAASDFLFVEGDYDAKVSGLAAWIPSTVTATSFFGVDRTQDSTRLGGVRITQGATPIDEALLSLSRRIGREGGAPDVCFMNHNRFSEVENALGSKVEFGQFDLPLGKIGFKTLRIAGPTGPISVVADHNCPDDKAYMLTMNTWKLYSLGPAPHILQLDGQRILRNAALDSYEIRVGYYGNLACKAPGYSGVLELT